MQVLAWNFKLVYIFNKDCNFFILNIISYINFNEHPSFIQRTLTPSKLIFLIENFKHIIRIVTLPWKLKRVIQNHKYIHNQRYYENFRCPGFKCILQIYYPFNSIKLYILTLISYIIQLKFAILHGTIVTLHYFEINSI